MRILIIEDEHRIANSLKKGLEQENYAVDVCFDGQTGYDMGLNEDYDLILLDLLLPFLDGVTVCRQLRENHIHTPIIILTAKGQVQDKVQTLDSGADDYLTKPFSFEELLARIRALIRRPKNLQSSRLTVSDLNLDPQMFIVTRGDNEIRLSSKEFSLLEFLMRHPKQILSKEQITAHVWNYEADILPNTIEVYIRNLRNKIDRPFPESDPLITTARGFGYRIG